MPGLNEEQARSINDDVLTSWIDRFHELLGIEDVGAEGLEVLSQSPLMVVAQMTAAAGDFGDITRVWAFLSATLMKHGIPGQVLTIGLSLVEQVVRHGMEEEDVE